MAESQNIMLGEISQIQNNVLFMVMDDSIFYEILEKALIMVTADQWLTGARSLVERGTEFKGHEKMCFGDGNVLYLDCAGDYRDVCFHQN